MPKPRDIATDFDHDEPFFFFPERKIGETNRTQSWHQGNFSIEWSFNEKTYGRKDLWQRKGHVGWSSLAVKTSYEIVNNGRVQSVFITPIPTYV